MWELYEELWDEQIGENKEVGYDFSGREIHKNDFGNPSSPYGWTLMPLWDKESTIVVHNKTFDEFPSSETTEFVINDKIFEVAKSSADDSWDINEINFETREVENPDYHEDDEEENDININNEYHFRNDDFSNNQTQEAINNDHYNNFKNDNRHYVDEYNNVHNNNSNRIDDLTKIIENQTKQIEMLRKEQEEFQTMLNNSNNNKNNQSYYSNDEFDNSNLYTENNNYIYEPSEPNTFEVSSPTSIIGESINNLDDNYSDQQLNIESNITEDDDYFEFKNPTYVTHEFETYELGSLNPGNNGEIDFKNLLWESLFGDAKIAYDFAGKWIEKKRYGKIGDGGWGIDYYDRDNSSKTFIASIESIRKRNGLSQFEIDGRKYQVINNNGNWRIIDIEKNNQTLLGRQNLVNNIRQQPMTRQQPNVANSLLTSQLNIDREINRLNSNRDSFEFESYSSLLINLHHFPVDSLDEFNKFILKTVSSFSIYKDFFSYSNNKPYQENKTNVSCYGRIYFRSSSIKNDIEIIKASLLIKDAMKNFISSFRKLNNHNVIDFSLVLTNHKRSIKNIQAQTNYEILSKHPVPLRTPLGELIVDGEFNSILKFNINKLWKILKPFALDGKGNEYYILDIKLADITSAFRQ